MTMRTIHLECISQLTVSMSFLESCKLPTKVSITMPILKSKKSSLENNLTKVTLIVNGGFGIHTQVFLTSQPLCFLVMLCFQSCKKL